VQMPGCAVFLLISEAVCREKAVSELLGLLAEPIRAYPRQDEKGTVQTRMVSATLITAQGEAEISSARQRR